VPPNSEQRTLHPGSLPSVEIAEKKVYARLHKPAEPVTSRERDNGSGVGREIAEILVGHEDETDAVSFVETGHAVNGVG
jgi:hypothetical protein